ncbi:MAG: LEA type 2 family protein [Deltaproteobacteria bacterium]|nr:LEA type 2 family protein [Deltaproteobacteria bacterium]
MLRLSLLIATVLGATACQSARTPELTVLGVREAARHEVVFLQVTNPASRTMRLTKLEYTFASQGERVSSGEVSLSRDVPAGAAVVVEVPLDVDHDGPMMLRGKLIAELDQIVRTFTVSAQVDSR